LTGSRTSSPTPIAGPGDDEEIGDTAAIVAKPGDRFFSVPRTINPGSGQ
jgi:hypothetical protein